MWKCAKKASATALGPCPSLGRSTQSRHKDTYPSPGESLDLTQHPGLKATSSDSGNPQNMFSHSTPNQIKQAYPEIIQNIKLLHHSQGYKDMKAAQTCYRLCKLSETQSLTDLIHEDQYTKVKREVSRGHNGL